MIEVKTPRKNDFCEFYCEIWNKVLKVQVLVQTEEIAILSINLEKVKTEI